MKRSSQLNMPKTVMAFGMVLLFALAFMLLGMFIDIQVISKYDYTPVSFTITLLFCGILVGVFLALRTIIGRKPNL